MRDPAGFARENGLLYRRVYAAECLKTENDGYFTRVTTSATPPGTLTGTTAQ